MTTSKDGESAEQEHEVAAYTFGLPRQLKPGSQVEPVRSAIPPRHRSRHGNLPRALAALVRIETVQIVVKFGQCTVNPQFEANSCFSELSFNINNYSCTNLASLLQLLPRRYTMCSSLSFQRCLITRGVTEIALAQTFTNEGGIEDHAFNLESKIGSSQNHRNITVTVIYRHDDVT